MLGLLLAIAAPAFLLPPSRASNDLQAVLAAARRTAVLRAEPVTLSIDGAGAWTLTGDATPDAPAIATGTLADSPGRAKVRVSPLGFCVPELASTAAGRDWNALGCGPTATAEPRS